jgi:hypothetical protein
LRSLVLTLPAKSRHSNLPGEYLIKTLT